MDRICCDTRSAVLFCAALLMVAGPRSVRAADGSDASDIRQIKQEIRRIKADEERERERQEKVIEELERKVDQLQGQNQQLLKSNNQIQTSSQKLQTQTSQQIQQIQAQVDCADRRPHGLGRRSRTILGQHQFILTGAVGGSFIYDRQTATNTFCAGLRTVNPLSSHRLVAVRRDD